MSNRSFYSRLSHSYSKQRCLLKYAKHLMICAFCYKVVMDAVVMKCYIIRCGIKVYTCLLCDSITKKVLYPTSSNVLEEQEQMSLVRSWTITLLRIEIIGVMFAWMRMH